MHVHNYFILNIGKTLNIVKLKFYEFLSSFNECSFNGNDNSLYECNYEIWHLIFDV